MIILPLDSTYRGAVNAYIRHLFGGPKLVTLGTLYDSADLPGFIAADKGALLGAALYRLSRDGCEVAALFSLVQGQGAGTKLLDAVRQAALQSGCPRLWLVTTNDNARAIRFYQRYGFALKAVHIGALSKARLLKPEIPQTGEDGIPIAHEFEFEIPLGRKP